MKQTEFTHIYECDQNVIYPIYQDQDICEKVLETLGEDASKIVDKAYGKITKVFTLGKYSFESLTFIGLGDSHDITTTKLRKAIETVSKTIEKESYFDVTHMVCDNIDIHKATQLVAETYLLTTYKETKVGQEKRKVVDLQILADEDVSEDVALGESYAQGINLARELSDTPANYMTPETLVSQAKKLAEEYNLECTILDKHDLQEMNAGGILAVNQGSEVPAYMICLKYTNDTTPYKAVVGKGLTFDSGGYNLKSNSYGMKYDMCGGADVFGIMKTLAATKAKANVYGIIPTTENLLNEKAYRPQDVITTLSGKTVEIVSTDAEGRLILCDGITYAQQLGATQIIDLATLTGACVRALGSTYTGVFSNDDDYYQQFEEALKESDEKGWRLPLDDEYFEMLNSTSADFKNSAGVPYAGASVAANFLNAFVNEGIKWIHLDIAGTADSNGKAATGAMIRTVVNMLKK